MIRFIFFRSHTILQLNVRSRSRPFIIIQYTFLQGIITPASTRTIHLRRTNILIFRFRGSNTRNFIQRNVFSISIHLSVPTTNVRNVTLHRIRQSTIMLPLNVHRFCSKTRQSKNRGHLTSPYRNISNAQFFVLRSAREANARQFPNPRSITAMTLYRLFKDNMRSHYFRFRAYNNLTMRIGTLTIIRMSTMNSMTILRSYSITMSTIMRIRGINVTKVNSNVRFQILTLSIIRFSMNLYTNHVFLLSSLLKRRSIRYNFPLYQGIYHRSRFVNSRVAIGIVRLKEGLNLIPDSNNDPSYRIFNIYFWVRRSERNHTQLSQEIHRNSYRFLHSIQTASTRRRRRRPRNHGFTFRKACIFVPPLHPCHPP